MTTTGDPILSALSAEGGYGSAVAAAATATKTTTKAKRRTERTNSGSGALWGKQLAKGRRSGKYPTCKLLIGLIIGIVCMPTVYTVD